MIPEVEVGFHKKFGGRYDVCELHLPPLLFSRQLSFDSYSR